LIDFWFSKGTTINAELFSHVKTLKELGYSLYIATNQEKYRAEYVWKNLGFENYFDRMYASGNLGALKEESLFFKKINIDLKLDHNTKIVFFDDDKKNIISSKKEGWNSVLYRSLEDFLNHPSIETLLKK